MNKIIAKLFSEPEATSGRYPLKNVADYVRRSGLWKAIPFVWVVSEDGSSHVQPLTGWSLLLWKLVTFKTFAFFGWLLIDFYLQFPLYLQRRDILYGYLHLFWITGFFVLSAVRLHFWLRYSEMVWATNQMIHLVHHFETAYPATSARALGRRQHFTRTWRLLDKFMILALIGSVGCCVPYGLLVIPFRRHRALFYPLLPVAWRHADVNPVLASFLVGGAVLFNMFFISFQVAGYFVESLILIVYIESIRNSLAVLHELGGSGLSSEQLMLAHQKLRLLNTAFEVAFGDFGLPAFKLSISTLIIFSTVAAIKFVGKVNFILITFSLFVSFVTAVAISILLLMAGKIVTGSHKVVRSAAAGLEGSLSYQKARAITRSTRVIAIQVGGLYEINRMTPLTYFTLLFSNLINILISFQPNS